MLLEVSLLERTERDVTLTTKLTFELSRGYADVTLRDILFCDAPGPYIAKLLPQR